MNHSRLACLVLLFASGAAQAAPAACEPYLAAAEKTGQQTSRHTITESDDGTRLEAIRAGGKTYMNTGERWQEMKVDLGAAENKMIAQIRSGAFSIKDCRKLGDETVDGIKTSVYAYTLDVPGLPSGSAKVYIGKDGLVHAQSTEGTRVRYFYANVAAPKL